MTNSLSEVLEKMDGLELLRSKKIGKTYLNFFKGFNE